MHAKIDKIWMNRVGDRIELRFDWSNDRHHAVMIEIRQDRDAVREALLQAAHLIGKDPHLDT